MDDLRDVFRLYASIPYAFGIDDYCWTVLTLVKASGFIGSYGSFQATARKLLFEGQLQAAQTFRITASTRIAGGALIGADKYMMFKFWHNNLTSKFASPFCNASSVSFLTGMSDCLNQKLFVSRVNVSAGFPDSSALNPSRRLVRYKSQGSVVGR